MFWSVRNPLRIPGLVTKNVRRWSLDTVYTPLPSFSRRESEWSVVSAGDLREKENDEDVEIESGGKWWMRVALYIFVFCAGIWGLWRYWVPVQSMDSLLEVQKTNEIVREVIYDDRDPSHVYLAPQEPLPPTRRLLRPLEPTVAHLDLLSYISTGELPPIQQAPSDTELGVEVDQIDLVYLWVNSTDPFFPEAFEYRMEEEGLPVERGQARRWRDNGELKGAVRSSVQNLGDSLRRVHIVSADYPLEAFRDDDAYEESASVNREQTERLSKRKLTFKENDTETEEEWTVGQIPDWIDWAGDDETITWHFHSDIYRLPRDSEGELSVGREVMGGMALLGDDGEVVPGTNATLEEEWRELALPTFNSFAIESRVGWITGLSEKFVMSNDDMFFLKPLSTSDFHHPFLGPVLRMAPQLAVYPYLTPDLLTSHGEWGGLQHASALLSKRFTNRPQAYPEHFPKSLTLPMMDDASIMFSEDLSIAATRGFRESKRGTADLEMAALASWLRIERWREALLWTWVIGKVGGVEGVWGEHARDGLKELFGTALEEGKNAVVRKGERSTVQDADQYLFTNNLDEPLKTRIRFSSLDGHLPKDPDKPVRQCAFMPYCLPDNYFVDTTVTYPAEDVFKRLAFERPQCGDCLIDALIAASGERGLSAFLPSQDTVYVPTTPQKAEYGPILPLTKEWTSTNFSLSNVIRSDVPINIRTWCLSLLGRYVYAIGATPAVFGPAGSVQQLSHRLGEVDRHPDTALVCINDDIPSKNELGAVKFKEMLGEWMEKRWPNPGPWERSAG